MGKCSVTTMSTVTTKLTLHHLAPAHIILDLDGLISIALPDSMTPFLQVLFTAHNNFHYLCFCSRGFQIWRFQILGGRNVFFVMEQRVFRGQEICHVCVEDFIRYKFPCFLRKKRYAEEGLRSLIDDDIAPRGPKIGIMRTDGEGESDGQFRALLREPRIKRENNSHQNPQYNGVAERDVGILRIKTVARL